MSIPSTEKRAGYTAGLRALADLLDDNPDVPLPWDSGASTGTRAVTFYCDNKAELATLARAFPGTLDKRVDACSVHYGFELHGKLHGLHLYAATDRDEVCERVVTGVETVTVPATEAVPAAPERVEEVETVEWICSPLLADAAAAHLAAAQARVLDLAEQGGAA